MSELIADAGAIGAIKGLDQEIDFLYQTLQTRRRLEVPVLLLRALRCSGRWSEALVMHQSFRDLSVDWLQAGLTLERLHLDAHRCQFSHVISTLVEYSSERREDITDNWIAISRTISASLDIEKILEWIAASEVIVRSHTSNTLRVDRYIDLLTNAFRKEVDDWSGDGVLASGTAKLVRVQFVTPSIEIFEDVEKWPDFISSLPPDVAAYGILPTESELKPSAVGFSKEITQLSSEVELGWRYEPPTAPVIVTFLPDVRIVSYRHDHRGGIIFRGNRTVSYLCNEHYMLSISGHCRVKSPRTFLPVAFAACSASPGNYYHELIDTFGSMMMYKYLNLSIPVVVPKKSDVMMPLYEALGLPSYKIYGQDELLDVEIHKLAAASPVPVGPKLAMFLHDIGNTFANDLECDKHTRLYISRKKTLSRRLSNEGELEIALAAMGFTVVYLEELVLESQIRLFRSAAVIVSPHGAGLANMVFSNPNSLIIEIIPRQYPADTFYILANACGHRYASILGGPFETYGDRSDVWSCDVGKVLEIVNATLSQLVDDIT